MPVLHCNHNNRFGWYMCNVDFTCRTNSLKQAKEIFLSFLDECDEHLDRAYRDFDFNRVDEDIKTTFKSKGVVNVTGTITYETPSSEFLTCKADILQNVFNNTFYREELVVYDYDSEEE